MQTWSMTCAVRAVRYADFRWRRCNRRSACKTHQHLAYPRVKIRRNSSLSSKAFGVCAALRQIHTVNADLCAHRAVLPKDRMRPRGGGTDHFLPTAAPPAVPFPKMCLCALQGFSLAPKQQGSVPQDQRLEDEPQRDRRTNKRDILSVAEMSNFVLQRAVNKHVSFGSEYRSVHKLYCRTPVYHEHPEVNVHSSGFYWINQNKAVNNCEVTGKWF